MKLKATELAWLAGLLEGEGHFELSRPDDRPNPRIAITVAMTDRDVILWAADLMGGRVYGPYEGKSPSGGDATPVWVAKLARRDDVLALLTRLLPFMGERRSERINEMLEVEWK